ncbi:MAG: DUF111 family protein [Pirellulales bacterium]
MLGETSDAPNVAAETIWVLETNLDQATGEQIGYSVTRLMDAGVLDVYTTAIQMKKNRPGTLLGVLAKPGDCEKLEAILFAETGTLGVRRQATARTALPRRKATVETAYGPVTGVVATLPDGTEAFAPEYEDCRRMAVERCVALRMVTNAARQSWSSMK